MEDNLTKPKSSRLAIMLVIAVCGALFLIYQNTGLKNFSFSKELTNSKVQRAFKKMKGLQDGSVQVNGIRAGQNFAGVTIVDVSLTNFQWRDGNNSAPPYNGPAVGVFTGYTDGRYTLKEVELSGVASHPKFTVEQDTDSEGATTRYA